MIRAGFPSASGPVSLLVLLLVTAARPGSAQEVAGQLLHQSSQSAIGGALVLLVDSAGRERARGISSPSGRFALRGGESGRYTVRVLRIGFAAWHSPPLRLEPGERREIRFLLDEVPVRLADIEITAAANRCGVRLGESGVLAGLLTEAEKALALAEQTIQEGRLRFRTETWTSRPSFDGAPGERDQRTGVDLARWPVLSAPPESLEVWGFVHEGIPYGTPPELAFERGPVYYAPDARVLFAPWFLDSHCFSLGADTVAGAPTLALRFTPIARRGRRDIAGELTLDRETLELRRLRFHYTGLPDWVPRDSAGGELRFRKLRTGAWIIDYWRLRAPIPRLRGERRTGLFGWAETGGQVREVRYGREPGEVERISSRHAPDRGIQVAQAKADARAVLSHLIALE